MATYQIAFANADTPPTTIDNVSLVVNGLTALFHNTDGVMVRAVPMFDLSGNVYCSIKMIEKKLMWPPTIHVINGECV